PAARRHGVNPRRLVCRGTPMAEPTRGGRGGRGARWPTPVGEALRAYLTKSGLGTRLAQAQVIPDWPTLVGPQIAGVTAPESVTPDGILFVRVATSAWMRSEERRVGKGGVSR